MGAAPEGPGAESVQPPVARPIRLLVLGDSLTAGYGLARADAFQTRLRQALEATGQRVELVDGAVSGDTTAGGRSRLPALLKAHRPAVVVIELGGNDALRGLSLALTEANLTAMTQAAQAAGAKVLLAGMQMPPNYGADFGRRFFALYPQVAKAQRAALVPFLLKGVADGDHAQALFQPDRIHPTAAAHPIILDNVWPELRRLLKP